MPFGRRNGYRPPCRYRGAVTAESRQSRLCRGQHPDWRCAQYRFPPARLVDCLIGNRPISTSDQLAKNLSREKIDQLRQRFRTARGNFDLYVIFIERAIELLRPGGRCGLIVPNKWATLDYARPCRELLLQQTTIEQVIDFSDARAFAGASVYPHILIFRKEPLDNGSHDSVSKRSARQANGHQAIFPIGARDPSDANARP